MAKDPRDDAKFSKVIDPPPTSKVNILQFTVDVDKGLISTVYQTGDDVPGGFKVSTQATISFNSVDGNGHPITDYSDLYTAMGIQITALVTALQQKL